MLNGYLLQIVFSAYDFTDEIESDEDFIPVEYIINRRKRSSIDDLNSFLKIKEDGSGLPITTKTTVPIIRTSSKYPISSFKTTKRFLATTISTKPTLKVTTSSTTPKKFTSFSTKNVETRGTTRSTISTKPTLKVTTSSTTPKKFTSFSTKNVETRGTTRSTISTKPTLKVTTISTTLKTVTSKSIKTSSTSSSYFRLTSSETTTRSTISSQATLKITAPSTMQKIVTSMSTKRSTITRPNEFLTYSPTANKNLSFRTIYFSPVTATIRQIIQTSVKPSVQILNKTIVPYPFSISIFYKSSTKKFKTKRRHTKPTIRTTNKRLNSTYNKTLKPSLLFLNTTSNFTSSSRINSTRSMYNQTKITDHFKFNSTRKSILNHQVEEKKSKKPHH